MSDSEVTATKRKTETHEGLVSCRLLALIFDVCEMYDIDIEDALQGIPYSPAHFRKKKNFIDWDSYRRILSNLSSRLTHAEIRQSGKNSFRNRLFRPFRIIGRTLIPLETLYRWLAIDYLTTLFPITSTVISQAPHKLHLRMTINEPLRHSPEFFLFFEGQFIGMSSTIGYDACQVETVLLDRGAEYIIRFPEGRSLLQILWGYIRKPYDLYIRSIEQETIQLDLKKAEFDLVGKSRDLEFESQRIQAAQKKLTDLERRYQLLEDTLLDLIWICDVNGRFTYVSPGMKPMLGYEVEEAMNIDMGTLLTERDRAIVLERFVYDLGLGEKVGLPVFEALLVRKDHSELWCEIHLTYFYDDTDRVEGVAGVVRDISERKQTDLEKRLLEQELSYSRHMESIGQLAGGIAHDFNNMLTTVLGFTDLARDGIDVNHELQSYLTEISRAGSRASELVKQLLTFSKQKPMEPVPLDVNELIQELDPMLNRLVSENIDLSIDLQPVPRILGDTAELERVIVNLCINAKDAMRDGGRLFISTREYMLSSDDGRSLKAGTNTFVCISVSDTGHGIEPDLQQKVLEPFFTTKPFGQGTGLGLAVSYSIVQQHNGFLDIVSQPDQGTTIKVFIPETHQIRVSEDSDEVVLEKNYSGTILVVEDQAQVRRLVVQILEGSGYNVIQARDGEEAVSIYQQKSSHINLVLMDIVMPKMGGRDAMAEMRKADSGARVLFMTAYSKEDPRTDFAMHSGYSVLRKPFTSADVIRRVSEIIEA